ncbi:MAG TPA: hypothetical protein VFS51_00550 [Gemmatimonadales bacterium]|nr:hypothetical protein [Gemmatimonadales bacterium]
MTHPEAVAVEPDPRKLLVPLLMLLLVGCGHTEPFGSPSPGTDQPFDPTPPVRLTLNLGPDRGAAWLPDGSGILYSGQQLGRSDQDVCLALLPPGGGRQLQATCDLTAEGRNLRDALESPAPAVDGRLAFVTAHSEPRAVSPDEQGIVLASVADPRDYRVLRPMPYTIPVERLHSGASQLRWWGENRLLYLAERVMYIRPCSSCPPDTLRSGMDATWLSTEDVGATPQRIPGTEYASGVSPGSNENEVYYTMGGDSRVFRRNLSDGAVSVVHDFGTAGIARDVHVVGNRMVAVVGGRVAFGTTPITGQVQWDSGGMLRVVDLQAGTDVALDGPGLFRRPQISPSGSAVVVEVYPVLDEGSPNATVSRSGDLYLYGQP